jgi:sphingomyelin phosphodiesterase acid-like 3
MKSFYEYNKLFLVFLAGILIFSLTGCTGTGNGTNTNNNFPVVVFSDVHFDPFYDKTLYTQLVANDADQWATVFQSSLTTAPSAWGDDTNYPLLALALSGIKQNLGASPLIIFTGDILGHDFPKTFFQLYYGTLDFPVPDDAAIAAMKAFADKTVAFFMRQVRSTIGDIPVMFAVGNADSYLGALPELSYLSNNAELYYTQFLNSTLDHLTFITTFTKGGYYSAEPAGTDLMVIGLNSVMFNYDFKDTLKTEVDAQLAWFDSQLAQAKADGKKVWLLMHIPPGADKYSTAQNNLDANGHLTTATMMWNQDYQARFLRILSHYPGTIALTLGAHTHMDEYRIMSPDNVLEITPGITPYFGNNPAFRVFTFSRYTYKPTDYSTLNCDLGASPAQFNSYYTFSTAYLLQGLLNNSLLQLYPQLAADNAKQQFYREHYFSGHNYTVPIGNEFYPITDKTWPVYWCGIGHMDEQGLIDCVNSY